MINENFFDKNVPGKLPKIKLLNKHYIYKSTCDILDDLELVRIIKFIKAIDKSNKFVKLPIIFSFGKIEVRSKLDYILLEYILYFLIKERGYLCCVNILFKDGITTYAAKDSPLNTLYGPNRDELKKQNKNFIKSFEYNMSINHYRNIIHVKDHGTDKCSKIATDIKKVLEHLRVEKKCASGISEVISELMDNAGEHAQADCLVDIDITSDHTKKNADGTFQSANIVVFNFSQDLICDKISACYSKGQIAEASQKKLREAYQTHSKYWGTQYLKDDFFTMSAFQNRISTRDDQFLTGGTGLTKIIKATEASSDQYIAFLLSGKRMLMFEHDYLDTDDFNWVGFNKENDFINYPPYIGLLDKSKLFFPGTAYNLNFILEKENKNE